MDEDIFEVCLFLVRGGSKRKIYLKHHMDIKGWDIAYMHASNLA